MQRILAIRFFVWLGSLVLMNSLTAGGKKTIVKEYFFLLPSEALPFTFETPALRKKFLVVPGKGDDSNLNLPYAVTKVIDDPRNGYLEVQYDSDLGHARTSLAIWRTDAGSDVIGVFNEVEESTRAVPTSLSAWCAVPCRRLKKNQRIQPGIIMLTPKSNSGGAKINL